MHAAPLSLPRARWLLAVSLGLAGTALAPPAHAVGLAGADPLPVVREEVLLVVFDAAAAKEHILYAARLQPAASSIQIALPVPASPEVQALGPIDLPLALHRLVVRHELAMLGREPAWPAPWSVHGVTVLGRAVPLAQDPPGGLPFDPSWLRSYAGGTGALALLTVTAPKDAQLEMSTPPSRISIPTDRPVLALREPPRPLPADTPEAAPDRAADPTRPYSVQDITTFPAADAPSAEAIAKVLRARTAPFMDCYERLLDRSPGTAAQVGIEVTVRPLGQIATVRSTGAAADADADLTQCVLKAVREKKFPRMDAGWRFTASVRFPPPRAPARVTHIAVLATERWTWPNPPASVTRVREFEPSWGEYTRALPPELRKTLGLRPPGRLWLAQYTDRSERRVNAADVTFVRADIPADGEPGTLGYAQEKQRLRDAGAAAGDKAGQAANQDEAASPWALWRNRRWRKAIAAGLMGLAAIALAFGLDRSR